jgi:hypothetical protein
VLAIVLAIALALLAVALAVALVLEDSLLTGALGRGRTRDPT